MAQEQKHVGVFSAAGYAGGELIRLLLKHPNIGTITVSSDSKEGMDTAEACHPFLKNTFNTKLVGSDVKNFLDCDLVVIAAEDKSDTSGTVESLLSSGIKVIDMTPTYRLGSEGRTPAVYGIPELHRGSIRGADLVATPGCMATAAILSAYPLSHTEMVDRVIFDCKIGLSAVGSQPAPRAHYPSASQSVYGYENHPHRHYPEIRDALKTRAHFFPQIVPVSRGILCSAYLHLNSDTELKKLKRIYEDFYAKDFFIRMVATPSTAFVRGSNFCDVGGFSLEDKLFVCSCAIDNLGKGGAGQAIQNMNLMLGFDERSGLDTPPIFP